MKSLSKLATWVDQRLGAPTTEKHLARVLEDPEVKVALDIGCGITSLLTPFRPGLTTVGLDIFTISAASEYEAHDYYITADIADIPVAKVQEQLMAAVGRPRVDLVTLFGVIEHFPKKVGLDLLDKIELLSDRYVLLDTPSGFVPQGPEYGNPYQRHLSGWFDHELEGRGYSVRGCLGTKFLRGYMGEPRLRIPGMRLFDNVVMTRLLMTERFPRYAFSMCAIKDLRGVPAKYSSYDDPRRI